MPSLPVCITCCDSEGAGLDARLHEAVAACRAAQVIMPSHRAASLAEIDRERIPPLDA